EIGSIDGPAAKPEAPSSHVGGAEPTKRASQTIPPATRRLVMRRHRGCCAVPGCRNALLLDVHHVELRSEGGDHDPENLVPLCSAHHRAVHDGRLLISGCYSTGF